YPSVHELGRALVPFASEGVTAARFRGPPSVAVGAAREKSERTLTFSDGGAAAPAAEQGTYGAVTANTPNALRRRARWPWAVGGAAVLAGVTVAVVLGMSRTEDKSTSPTNAASATNATTSLPSEHADSTLAATATATASNAIAGTTASIAAPAAASVLASASTKPTATTKPTYKPATKPTSKPPVKKPWGSAIDDPL
ncbi:MAG: hypothetical protein ABI175_23555, partial [Polyangiales bacterium]